LILENFVKGNLIDFADSLREYRKLYIQDVSSFTMNRLCWEFGNKYICYGTTSIQRMEFAHRPCMVANRDQDTTFVINANENHWILLSNIDFQHL
jgi:hypothetical protein